MSHKTKNYATHYLLAPMVKAVGHIARLPLEIPGKWRLNDPLLRAIRKNDLGIHDISVKMKDGFAMHLDLRDWVDSHLFAKGEHEPDVGTIIKKVLRPGDHFLDVGANIGYFTILASRIVGVNGRVTSFEPSKSIFARLSRNVALNKLENVDLHNSAVSDAAGNVLLHLGPTSQSGITSLRPLEESSGSTARTQMIEAITLDSLFTNSTKRPRLLKIDVEGAELRVLKGMKNILDGNPREKPFIIFEFSPGYLKNMGDSGDELLSLLQFCGYQTHVIGYFGNLESKDLRSVDESSQFNVIAIPQERRQDVSL
ncbi:MAG: FkbM family methyltransferase [Pirellula sp.]